MAVAQLYEPTIERMFSGVEKVKARLAKAVAALEAARIRYAVIGGNAVANHVTRVDEGAERFTKDVDILVSRGDLELIKTAMAKSGFHYAHSWGVDLFYEEGCKPSQGVHLLFENEKVKPDCITPIPSLDESERTSEFQVVTLEALVRMKLESNRDKDRTHVRDIIGVGLIDQSWVEKYPSPLSDRLQSMLDTPGG